MDLWSLKALWVTNCEVHRAKILPENTLMYSSYIYQKLRLYVEDKILFECMSMTRLAVGVASLVLMNLWEKKDQVLTNKQVKK